MAYFITKYYYHPYTKKIGTRADFEKDYTHKFLLEMNYKNKNEAWLYEKTYVLKKIKSIILHGEGE